MNVTSALLLVGQVDCGPNWRLTAEDYTHRQEATICVTTHVATISTDRKHWPYKRSTPRVEVRAHFLVYVGDCADAEDLYRRLFDQAVVPTLVHEGRELFRIRPTGWAPFHPHHRDGMLRWGAVEHDQKYGLA